MIHTFFSAVNISTSKPETVQISTAQFLINFINEVKIATETFYNNIPSDTCYVGIKSETETFIHNIFKYKYLFEISDVRPY